MTKTKDFTKDLTDLPDSDIQDTIEAIFSVNKPDKKDEKWIRFHLLRMFGVDTQTSARLVGFNPTYGYKLLQKYRNDTNLRHTLEQFVSRMPDDYRTVCRLMLPDIAEAEMGAVRLYKSDPELLLRHPQLAKSIKMAAGVQLSEEPAGPKVVTYNIKEIQMLHHGLFLEHTGVVQDAEVVQDSDKDKK